jgi:hypothetical protein
MIMLDACSLFLNAIAAAAAAAVHSHGNYTTKHKGMKAERQFVPPNNLR